MSVTTDRRLWESIADSDAEVPPGLTAGELLPSLLDLLGENDPYLRDDVGYSVLARWVVQDQLLGPDELRYAVERLDAGPAHRARRRRGRPGRACAARTRRWPWRCWRSATSRTTSSTPTRSHRLLDAAMAYLLDETDRRGYVPSLGWINATAHAADLLKFLVRNPFTDTDHHRRVLRALQVLLTRTTGPVFIDDEEDRLVLVVVDVIGRETIGDDELCDWIDRFGSWLADQAGSFDPPARAATVNLKRFIRTLHLALSSRAHRRGLPFDKPEVAALDIARRFAAGPI